MFFCAAAISSFSAKQLLFGQLQDTSGFAENAEMITVENYIDVDNTPAKIHLCLSLMIGECHLVECLVDVTYSSDFH